MENSKQNNYVTMTPTQRKFFESNGYLVIKEAISADTVAELDNVINEIYKREEKDGRLKKRQTKPKKLFGPAPSIFVIAWLS